MPSQTINNGESGSTVRSKINSNFAAIDTATGASALLTAVKTVDGAGSGLDADLLDGTNPSAAGLSILSAANAAAQTALLSTFTSGAKGLAPASGGGTTNYLRADGTWAEPAGGGGGGVGSVTTTWDPATADPDVTLSGGNLTASTGTQASRTWVYSTESVTGVVKTGVKLTIAALGDNIGSGLIKAGQTDTYGGGPNSLCLYAAASGAYLSSGGSVGTAVSFAATGVYWLFNFSTRKAWYSYDATTYRGPDGNTGDPVTGTNGISMPTGALQFFLELQGTGTRTCTVDFDDASWMPSDTWVSWNVAAATEATSPVTFVSPLDYGAEYSNSATLVSSEYATLGEAQAAFDGAYFFLDSMSVTKDWAGTQAAAYAAFGVPGSEHGNESHLNKELRLPPGRAQFGNKTVVIRNTVGARITGAGRLATKLIGETTLIRFNGLWYSRLEGFSCEIQGVATAGAMVVDGNWQTNLPGEPMTRGVQGITFLDMFFDGGGGASSRALEWCPVGTSFGQGSESVFINCHFQNANICYSQNGYNALSNTFVGGNFQNYDVGIYCWGGTFSCYNTAFQAQRFDQAIIVDAENAQWHCDVNVGSNGSGEGVILSGCRTESTRFLWHGGSVSCTVSGVKERSSAIPWSANTPFGPGSFYSETVMAGGKYWYTEDDGETGATPPDWSSVTADGGTLADGTVTWVHKVVKWIQGQNGGLSIDYNTVVCENGIIEAINPQNTPGVKHVIGAVGTLANPYRSKWDQGPMHCDCTAADRHVWLDYTAMNGRSQDVYKLDSSANDVTVHAHREIIGGVLASGTWSLTFGAGVTARKTFILQPAEGGGGSDGKWSVF